jgi:hypothetical protein
MSRLEEMAKRLDDLIAEGDELLVATVVELGKPADFAAVRDRLERRSRKTSETSSGGEQPAKSRKSRKSEDDHLSRGDVLSKLGLKRLSEGYQEWYSEALRVVQQLLPDRYDEFRGLYSWQGRKRFDIETYTISDYLLGLAPRADPLTGEVTFDYKAVVYSKLSQQQSILRSAKARMGSLLTNIRGLVEADVQDAELEVAVELMRARHVRAAGVVAGVVLERHLKRLIEVHAIPFRKKAQLGNLNQTLRDADVDGVPTWRKIQHLTDLRNLCGHDSEREPTTDEADELIRGVGSIVRTVS